MKVESIDDSSFSVEEKMGILDRALERLRAMAVEVNSKSVVLCSMQAFTPKTAFQVLVSLVLSSSIASEQCA